MLQRSWSFGPKPTAFDGEPPEDEFDLAKTLANTKAKTALEEWFTRERLKPVQDQLTAAQEKLSKFKVKDADGKDVDLTPEDATEAYKFFKSKGDLESEVRRAQREVEERFTNQIKTLTEAKTAAESKNAAEVQARHNLMTSQAVAKALADTGVKPEKAHLHALFLKNFVVVHVENGTEKIVIRDENNQIRYGANGMMTPEEFVVDYREKQKVADDWQAITRAGAGTFPGAGPRGPNGRAIDPSLPPEERMRQARAGATSSQRK